MPVTKPELKARLMGEAEWIIERLLERCDPTREITLNDMEEGCLGRDASCRLG